MRSVAFILITCVFAGPLLGQDVNSDGVVTYLLPVNASEPVPGAYGSTWQTQLWVHNGSEEPLAVFGCGDPGVIRPVPMPCDTETHPPGVTEPALPHETDPAFPAVLLSVPARLASGVVLSSRLFELSRGAQSAGLELPVVREDRFLTAPTRLIALPQSGAVRTALRVYDPRPASHDAVLVEVISTTGLLLAAEVLLLPTASEVVPGMAFIIDLAERFPVLLAYDYFDVRISPVRPGAEYWAMVSVTDNANQQVFTITPG